MHNTTHLGKVSNEPTEILDLVPWAAGPIVVELDCSEFSSHCPVTGQPDYARLLIRYVPKQSLIETKSLKLFLWYYRDKKQFNEALVAEIFSKIKEQLNPEALEVRGEFNPRGGISVKATRTFNLSGFIDADLI